MISLYLSALIYSNHLYEFLFRFAQSEKLHSKLYNAIFERENHSEIETY